MLTSIPCIFFLYSLFKIKSSSVQQPNPQFMEWDSLKIQFCVNYNFMFRDWGSLKTRCLCFFLYFFSLKSNLIYAIDKSMATHYGMFHCYCAMLHKLKTKNTNIKESISYHLGVYLAPNLFFVQEMKTSLTCWCSAMLYMCRIMQQFYLCF